MHIHELIIHRDLDTPLEIEIFAFESKRIYCVKNTSYYLSLTSFTRIYLIAFERQAILSC